MKSRTYRSKSYNRSLARSLPLQFLGGRSVSLGLVFLSLLFFAVSAGNMDAFQNSRMRVVDMMAPAIDALATPVYAVADYVGMATGIANLQAENAKLREENLRLREWYETALKLEAQNKDLQELLNIRIPSSYNYITSRVIADSGSAYVDSLLVMAGAKDGVEKGQAVLAADGLVGRVIENGQNSARILLLSDMNSRIPVLLEGQNWRAIMAGTNETQPVLLHLPDDLDVNEGLRVVTSGHGGLFPPGLPVGEAYRDEQGQVRVRPYADVRRIRYVRIIDKKASAHLQLGPR